MADDLTPDELELDRQIASLWNLARLRFLLDDHQTLIYDSIRSWEGRALDDPAPGEKRGMARVHIALCGRQVGKTYTHVLIRDEDCRRTPGGLFRYACPLYKDITEIVIPNMHALLETCPPSLRPEYRGSSKGMHEGFYYPNGAVLRLVGLDRNPRGLVGRTCDGDTISEARDLPDLDRIIGSVLYPQYQRRRRARLHIETSAPEDPDHVLDTKFIPDAKRRNAYVELTIDDNLALDNETKAEFLEAAYEIDAVSADLEYRNKRTRDGKLVILPEFDDAKHVVPVERPTHAYGIVAADPGLRHLFGLVFGYVDFDNQRLVIEASDALSNASTLRVMAVCAAREYDLYGSWPAMKLRSIPLETEGDRVGWRELLIRHPLADLAEDLHHMATTLEEERPDYESRPGRFIVEPPSNHFTFYDGKRFNVNPNERVTDVDRAMVADTDELFGMQWRTTSKDDLKNVMVTLIRNWLSWGQLVFVPEAGVVLDHARAGLWDKNRRKFAEHKTYGHFDVLAALMYAVRAAERLLQLRPYPPENMRFDADANIIQRVPWAPKEDWELELDRVREEAARSGHQRGRLKPWNTVRT